MSIIIGAETAKLAGLQIDTMTKLRNGQLTLGHWERFLNLSHEAREERFGDVRKPKPAPPAEPVVKFELLADLGVIVVPADYDHAKCLAAFKMAHEKEFYYFNPGITDVNFPNPSRILKPGDRLRVKVYKQVVRVDTMSVERMDYLKSQNMTVRVGAQGASLVYLQKKDELPKGLWYASFDEKERLWADANGRRVPSVEASSDGDFSFNLGYFVHVWDQGGAFFGFCDEQPNSPLVA